MVDRIVSAKKPPAEKPEPRARPARTPRVVGAPTETIEQRLDRIEDRLDRMADALVPALRLWKNIRSRIPAWILDAGQTRRPLESDDSEE